jgi:hypothetical protein
VKSLIEVQLEVLFARNERGRLTATRDPDARPAPRIFLGRSPERNVWAIRVDVDRSTRLALDRFCAAEPRLDLPRADRGPSCRELVKQVLAPIQSEWRGPAYVLPEDLPCDDRAREVTAHETSDWCEAFPWLADHFDAAAPAVVAFADGRPASVCHSPRGCTALAAEAGVETLEPFRNRGLATAAVACWARAVQRTGRLALYSTSWENAASLAVARRLSARLYGEDWHLS